MSGLNTVGCAASEKSVAIAAPLVPSTRSTGMLGSVGPPGWRRFSASEGLEAIATPTAAGASARVAYSSAEPAAAVSARSTAASYQPIRPTSPIEDSMYPPGPECVWVAATIRPSSSSGAARSRIASRSAGVTIRMSSATSATRGLPPAPAITSARASTGASSPWW